jgi:hypothetical protein
MVSWEASVENLVFDEIRFRTVLENTLPRWIQRSSEPCEVPGLAGLTLTTANHDTDDYLDFNNAALQSNRNRMRSIVCAQLRKNAFHVSFNSFF